MKHLTKAVIISVLFFISTNRSSAQVNWDANTVTGYKASSLGRANTSTGSYSFTSGYQNQATHSFSFAMGYGAKSTNQYSGSLGILSESSGYPSFSIGNRTKARGDNSYSIGTFSEANGDNSYAFGYAIKATANGSMTIGSGVNSTTMLDNTKVNSLMVGFNSDIPTLFVGPSTGAGFSGNVGIGTTKVDGFKLSVEGKVRAREIEVNALTWADFVFEDDYELQSLAEVEEFITENNHLPNVPSEKEVTAEGINLGEMDAILLRKIEELTLYILKQEKRINELEKK